MIYVILTFRKNISNIWIFWINKPLYIITVWWHLSVSQYGVYAPPKGDLNVFWGVMLKSNICSIFRLLKKSFSNIFFWYCNQLFKKNMMIMLYLCIKSFSSKKNEKFYWLSKCEVTNSAVLIILGHLGKMASWSFFRF